MAELKSYSNDIVDMVNSNKGKFDNLLGLNYVKIEPEYIEAELEIKDEHTQPFGLVHGGLYCSIIEAICSVGATLQVLEEGKISVGLENTTSFLRAVRSGKLKCVARPVVTGRSSHSWEGEIYSENDRLIAKGKVRLLILDVNTQVDGKKLILENP